MISEKISEAKNAFLKQHGIDPQMVLLSRNNYYKLCNEFNGAVKMFSEMYVHIDDSLPDDEIKLSHKLKMRFLL